MTYAQISLLLVLCSIGGACRDESAPRPSTHVPNEAESVSTVGASSTGVRSDASEPDARSANTEEIASWGIEIELPADARSEHRAEADRHRIDISRTVSVTLARIDRPPPTPAESVRAWNSGRDVEKFDDGTLPGGIIYAVRSQVVRVGMPGGGRASHRLQEVGRVYAIFPLGDGHIQCTGYVERPVEPSDPDLELVKRICLSMTLQ